MRVINFQYIFDINRMKIVFHSKPNSTARIAHVYASRTACNHLNSAIHLSERRTTLFFVSFLVQRTVECFHVNWIRCDDAREHETRRKCNEKKGKILLKLFVFIFEKSHLALVSASHGRSFLSSPFLIVCFPASTATIRIKIFIFFCARLTKKQRQRNENFWNWMKNQNK